MGFSTSGSEDFLQRFLKTLLVQIKNFLRKIFNREIQKKILRKRKAGKLSYRKDSLTEAGSLINRRSFKTIFPFFFHFFYWEVITEFSNFIYIKRHPGRHMHDTHLDMRGLRL